MPMETFSQAIKIRIIDCGHPYSHIEQTEYEIGDAAGDRVGCSVEPPVEPMVLVVISLKKLKHFVSRFVTTLS